MKICPKCRKTYADDGLNFCLDDGSVLNAASNDLPETMIINQPRPTDPSGIQSPNTPHTWQSTPTQPAQFSMQPPRKSSKAWVWVLVIFGGLILLCGGGFAGLVALTALTDTGNENIEYDLANTNNVKPSPSPSPFDSTSVQRIDLSEWVRDSSDFGTTEMVGDELHMAAKQKGFYYVLVAPLEFSTDSAATKVTVRNVNNADSNLGYGLIFHSDTTPLTRDMAFLIDSKKRKYRVVKHQPKKETTVIGWTSSTAINPGTGENILEARDNGNTVELYINGRMVNTVKNTNTPRGGVAGLYSGDAAKVAFKRFEISR